MVTESLIHALITEKSTTILGRLKKHYFDDADYEIIGFIKEYYSKYRDFPDSTTIENKFKIQVVANNSPADYWLSELRERSKDVLVDELIRELAKGKSDKVVAIQDALASIASDSVDTPLVNYGADTKGRLDSYKERKSGSGVTYLSTGDTELDKFTGGYKTGDFWLIAGYEKLGKSFKLLRLANDVSKVIADTVPDKSLLFVSLEVVEDEFIERLDSINAKISYERFSDGALTKNEEFKLRKYYKKLDKSPERGEHRFNFDSSIGTIDEVEMLISIYNPAIVFIDSVHLIAKSMDWKDMMGITQKLKKIARITKVPIVVTVHANLAEGDGLDKIKENVFSYFKAGRDPDMAFVMFRDTAMMTQGLTGMVSSFIRRKKKFVHITKVDWNTMQETTSSIDLLENYDSDDLDDDDSAY